MMPFKVKGRDILAQGSPVIMGILNVTPDSFSDGGRYSRRDNALRHAEKMLAEGADIIDVGGESSRPGAAELTVDEELDRVMPVLDGLSSICNYISIDTRKAAVAEEAFRSGAAVLNDISGLKFDASMASTAAAHSASVILMHMLGSPETMQTAPKYSDLHGEILNSLEEAVHKAEAAGIDPDCIAVDPGIGFGKTLDHNLEILRSLHLYSGIGKPVLIGVSRKSFIGAVTGAAVDDRLAGTLAAVAFSRWKGAQIFRVHDVAECRQALLMADALGAGI